MDKQNNTHRLFSVSLSFGVMILIIAVGIAVLSYFYFSSKAAILQDATDRAEQTLDNTILRVEKILDEVVTAESNMKWLVLSHLDSPDSMYTYSKEILKNNPNAIGCSIAFEPYFFSKTEKWFSAYSYNEGDTILTEQEGTERYDFYELEWYKKPKQLGKSYWIDPFHEIDTGGIEVPDIITSYCSPMYDRQNRFVGVFSIDISLKWLSERISDMKPYPNSYSVMIDTNGRYIVHPDSTRIFYETIFDNKEIDDDSRMKLGRSMIAGDSGYTTYKKAGETFYTFYKPLGSTGWSIAIVCPESDVLDGYDQMNFQLLIATGVGLIILLCFCWYAIRSRARAKSQQNQKTN